jgi:hypothetical protein
MGRGDLAELAGVGPYSGGSVIAIGAVAPPPVPV